MNVRTRRLQADHEQIKDGLRHHPAIRIRGVSGTPPERYQIEFNVRSVVERADGTITEQHEHVAEITLTLAYPKQAPQCRMLTPVFHPNIAPHAICIGDHWAAGESLLNLIIRIGEMLAYQGYNTQSPLNGAAARWVDENEELLPIDPRDLSPQAWADADREVAGKEQCQNCHAAGKDLTTCAAGHSVCADCLLTCARCDRTFCLLCKLESCTVCGRLVCADCRSACPQCERMVCTAHLEACRICGAEGCPDCIITCLRCERPVCLTHVRQCAVCREALCVEHAVTCAGCGKALCEAHAVKCEVCDNVGCADCIFRCQACGANVCVEHVAQCTTCRRVLCPEHCLTCSTCGQAFCATHFDAPNGLCLTCRTRPDEPAPAEALEAAILLECPACHAQLKVPGKHLGKRVKCPKCSAVTTAR